MKIVHLIQTLETGGAEKVVVDLALEQNKEHDVTVISQYPRQGSIYEKWLEDAGVEVVYLSKAPGLSLKSIAQITKTLRRLKPDAVHTHMHAAVYAIPYYILDRRCAKIHTVHSIALGEFGKAHRKIQEFAYRHLGEIPVSICDTVRKTVLDEYRIKESPVIYNGISAQKFSAPKKEHDHFVIINVASFHERKNQMMLLTAFEAAHRENPDLRLVFVGDGAERARIEKNARDMGFDEDTVKFAGIRGDVPELLAQSDLFVLCSTVEGLPLCILEAFSEGLPVVSSDAGGVRDIVKNGVNGYVVDIDDCGAMAEKILLLSRDASLHTRIAAENKRISPDFDLSVMAGNYMRLYKSELKKHRR